MQQHFFSKMNSRKRKVYPKRDQQKRAIIQNLSQSYSLKKCKESVQNKSTVYNSFSLRQPNLLAIASTPYSQKNETKINSKLSMRDEWKRLNCSFPINSPFTTKLNQTFLPKVPLCVQFPNNPSINRPKISASTSRFLQPISASDNISSTTLTNKPVDISNSTNPLTEPLVEEPASDNEEDESQMNIHSEYNDSDPEEEDGILIEKAIPIAKGCDNTNISSRVFLDQEYLKSLFNRKVTLHISEISELFSYENDSKDVDENNETPSKKINDEHASNSEYSEMTKNSNVESILMSSKTNNVSYSTSNTSVNKASTSKLQPLNIETQSILSSPTSSQSPPSTPSTHSLRSPPLPSPSVIRKKVSLTGAKKCVLESYSIESEKTTSQMPVKKTITPQKDHFHSSSFLDRLTSEMIDNGALLSEDEDEKEKELEKVKSKNSRKKEKSLLLDKKPGTSKSSKIKRSLDDEFGESRTIIRPAENVNSSECRRSVRNRVRPLDFWTGQRPVYHVTVDNKGSPLKTLVGVHAGNVEPKKTKNSDRKKHFKTDKNQKMVNIFNLSIDNPRFAKKFTNTESHDQEHVLAFNQVNFRESSRSPGVFTALTKKESNIAFGKLKFTPKSVKKRTKTGKYISHFNVVYGTLLLKLENEKVGSIIKTGFYFHVAEQTNYTLTNLRNDEAMIDFTIIKEN